MFQFLAYLKPWDSILSVVFADGQLTLYFGLIPFVPNQAFETKILVHWSNVLSDSFG